MEWITLCREFLVKLKEKIGWLLKSGDRLSVTGVLTNH
jgi:hypothetical protein